MAMDSSTVNNLYFTYKSEEQKSFESLFPKQDWRGWSLQRLKDMTASVVLSLGKKQREVIIGNFERSSKARKDYSVFFSYAPPQSRWRHDAFVDLLMTLIAILKAAALPEAETPKVAVAQQAETLERVSVNEAAFLGFLEHIELLVDQAVALWPRAAAGDLRLSTASKLTSTFLRRIDSMVSAESLLNESWFGSSGLVAMYRSNSSPFWNELQSCAGKIKDFGLDMITPLFDSDLYIGYAPLVTEMLVKGTEAQLKDGSSIVLKAAIAASFVFQCNKLNLDLDKLRTSVNTRISEAAELFQKCKSHFSNAAAMGGGFDEGLSITSKFQIWAEECDDVASFGEMMSWLEPQIVHGKRCFVFENAALQHFAYIYESGRIRERTLHPELEALFNDPRVAPFLFMDGRPKTPNDCRKGIENWSDPSSVRSVTTHVFKVRDTRTLTEQIGELMGAVTHEMVQLLGDKTLEQYLNWELDFPDPVRFEDSLIKAARSVAKNDSIDYITLWAYLKYDVLNNSKNLLDTFMKQWVPKVRGEGSGN